MKVIFVLVRSIFYLFARNCYWLYRASQIKAGKGIVIKFPFKVEGKGKIIFGNRIRIDNSVTLAVGANSQFVVNDNCFIAKNVTISLARDTKLEIGKNFCIQSHTLCYAAGNWVIGEDVTISSFCQIFGREPGYKGNLIVGSGTNIGDYTIIDVSADVRVGSKVAIGPKCTIYTHDHDYNDKNVEAPWKGKPVAKPVIIGDGTWIGSNVIILPGVKIGSHAIVGAGSVVTRDVLPNSINAGIPARMIKLIDKLPDE